MSRGMEAPMSLRYTQGMEFQSLCFTDLSLSEVKKKLAWASWRTPIIPVTQEAEAGELLEPRRQRLQCTEIVPLYSSLGDRARLIF